MLPLPVELSLSSSSVFPPVFPEVESSSVSELLHTPVSKPKA